MMSMAATRSRRATPGWARRGPVTAATGVGMASGAQADQKHEILTALATRDESCRLRTGISNKSDPLRSVARFWSRWNAALRSDHSLGDAFDADEWQVLLPA